MNTKAIKLYAPNKIIPRRLLGACPKKVRGCETRATKRKNGKTDQALSFIQKLYNIERTSKDKSLGERLNIRQTQSKDVIEKLKKCLDKSQTSTPPKSSLGKAIGYLNNPWQRLIGYLDDGAYPMDSN